jgi:hydroxyacylglutathione hydrolase
MYWLIGSGTVVAILLVVIAMYLLRIRTEIRKLSPIPSGEVVDNIFAIRDGHVNLFLLKDGDRYVAIDAGQHVEILQQELQKVGINTNAVAAVLLTHTDRDHVGGLGLFRDAKAYVPKAEEALLDGTTHRLLIFGNKIAGPYETIGSSEEMIFGAIRVLPILTPGHTPGSTCYLVNGKFLFTGDTMSLKGGRADIFSRLFNMDTPRQAESFKDIARLAGVKYVFTAHHGFTDNYDAVFEKWRG